MNPLDVALIVLGAGVVALMLSSLGRRPPPTEPPAPPDRVLHLCSQLTGEPAHDQIIINQLLALGQRAFDPVLDLLAALLRDPDAETPAQLARIEGLLADFGLAILEPIAQRLTRLQPTAPLANALIRVVYRLGQPGAQTWVALTLAQPGLTPYLPRFQRPRGDYRDPAAAVSGALIPHLPRLSPDILDRLAALIVTHPDVIDDLWAAVPVEGRAVLLGWLGDWLPVAEGHHVVAGLTDRATRVRQAAARLARLMVEPALVPALVELATDADPACRVAALRALAHQPVAAARATLQAAASDADPGVCLTAIDALAFAPDGAFEQAVGVAAVHGLAHHPLLTVLHALTLTPGATPLLALPEAWFDEHPIGVTLLARGADPRAAERLIRWAGDGSAATRRARAVATLARTRHPSAAEHLAAAAAHPHTPEGRLILQEAAQLLGDRVVMPLSRQMRGDVTAWAPLLPVLRAVDHADAVPALLHALSDAHPVLATTITAGGTAARNALDEGLRLPSLGLLTPALRYLSGWATARDVPLLIELYDAHPPLRAVILNLIETQAGDARAALAQRIAAGGDDDPLHALEQRHAILDALGDAPWIRER